MHQRINRPSVWLAALILSMSTLYSTASATIVEIQTVAGPIEVNLYDNATPATVANFLDYVNNGGYNDSIFHRSVNNFVIQGGGFRTDAAAQVTDIPANPSVVNEPEFSNVRGTISMAKLSGQPDSATNQWFINLSDNSTVLDDQNGGFTAFGQVVGNGMTVVDDIANLPTYAFGSPFGELPLQNYTAADFTNAVPVDNTHLVIVSGISIIDSTVGGGGGSLGFLALFGLLLGYRLKRS